MFFPTKFNNINVTLLFSLFNIYPLIYKYIILFNYFPKLPKCTFRALLDIISINNCRI
ncbi:hypothetical protein HMPREF3229_00654 [Peptoniphilus harei]|uniref:Uncharacterized protein n=1 Tax=Peptoniphilus harei TaxID=54005 RepID=A0A133PQY2_9FIRM|nr:hypothetical protein HMPREF3229_00654 [Peptoniphilus harei]